MSANELPLIDFAEMRPTTTFLQVETDSGVTKSRTTIDTLLRFEALYGRGSWKGKWRLEQEGEAGVWPTAEETHAIHGDDGCPTPCAKCEAAGYDGVTGQSKGVA